MNRPRLVRALRIAWSVMWGIACVLLCVLWVRSYWHADYLRGTLKFDNLQIVSDAGRLLYTYEHGDYFGNGFSWLINESVDVESDREQLPFLANWVGVDIDTYTPSIKAGFCAGETVLGYAIMVPHWFAALTIGTLGALPWLRWSKRFSLRTLLIATTLIAVGSGLIVWSMH